jgi:hypothetical protein
MKTGVPVLSREPLLVLAIGAARSKSINVTDHEPPSRTSRMLLHERSPTSVSNSIDDKYKGFAIPQQLHQRKTSRSNGMRQIVDGNSHGFEA